MKRLSLIFALVILLAGCAVGPTSIPSYGQGYGGQSYGGYNYPSSPQNPYANPWVGNNTPWTYYQGDWFLNGILQQFFGNQYGWAPYYAYPPTYIVRPNNWYAPQWNAWYQRNPHYWQNFEQKYPYWRGHRVGQRYDEKFYNKYHRGHGEGWNKGFHGVRPPVTAPGHGVRSPGAPVRDPRATGGPGVQTPGVPGRGARDPRATGPVGPHPGAPTPGVRGPVAPVTGSRDPRATGGPGVQAPGTAGPAVQKPRIAGPGGPPPGATAPGVRGPGAPGGTGVQAPGAAGRKAPATGERKPQKTTRGEEKPQQ